MSRVTIDLDRAVIILMNTVAAFAVNISRRNNVGDGPDFGRPRD